MFYLILPCRQMFNAKTVVFGLCYSRNWLASHGLHRLSSHSMKCEKWAMPLEDIQVYGSRGYKNLASITCWWFHKLGRKKRPSQAWWCRCVTLATQQAKEKELIVQGHHRQLGDTLSQNKEGSSATYLACRGSWVCLQSHRKIVALRSIKRY